VGTFVGLNVGTRVDGLNVGVPVVGMEVGGFVFGGFFEGLCVGGAEGLRVGFAVEGLNVGGFVAFVGLSVGLAVEGLNDGGFVGLAVGATVVGATVQGFVLHASSSFLAGQAFPPFVGGFSVRVLLFFPPPHFLEHLVHLLHFEITQLHLPILHAFVVTSFPHGLALDPTGKTWIVRVRVWTPASQSSLHLLHAPQALSLQSILVGVRVGIGVGEGVGDGVGFFVGTGVGAGVGEDVGDGLGMRDGLAVVGLRVGGTVGDGVGDGEGTGVGGAVGVRVVGATVGLGVGTTVGGRVGGRVGGLVFRGVGARVGERVGLGFVGAADGARVVGANVGDMVGGGVGPSVGVGVGDFEGPGVEGFEGFGVGGLVGGLVGFFGALVGYGVGLGEQAWMLQYFCSALCGHADPPFFGGVSVRVRDVLPRPHFLLQGFHLLHAPILQCTLHPWVLQTLLSCSAGHGLALSCQNLATSALHGLTWHTCRTQSNPHFLEMDHLLFRERFRWPQPHVWLHGLHGVHAA
jgi:hypothetical protein